MSSIRKYLYPGLLALATVNIAPARVSAQTPAHGQFKLPHEVHWQSALIPAGEYQFSLETSGASGMLTLSKTNDARTGFMILVNDIDEYTLIGVDQLVLAKTSSGSYVSALELPRFGMVLRFPVPASVAEKQSARNTASSSGPGQ